MLAHWWVANALATVPGILGPQVVGALTYRWSARAQWQKFFYIATAICCFDTVMFVLFGSARLQDGAVVSQNATSDGQDEKLEQNVGEWSGRAVSNASKM